MRHAEFGFHRQQSLSWAGVSPIKIATGNLQSYNFSCNGAHGSLNFIVVQKFWMSLISCNPKFN